MFICSHSGFAISPSGTFFTTFRSFTHSTMLTVTGQLMDLQAALFPEISVLEKIITELTISLIDPLDQELLKIEKLIKIDQENNKQPSPNQELMSQKLISQILWVIRTSILSREPLQWWDVRFSIWGNPGSRQTTILSSDLKAIARPNTELSLALHFDNCTLNRAQSQLEAQLQKNSSPEVTDMYTVMVERLGRLPSPPTAAPFNSRRTTEISESSKPIHAMTNYGALISFVITHITKLCKQTLSFPNSRPPLLLQSSLCEFISRLESVFSALTRLRDLNSPTLVLIESHATWSLIHCLAALTAIAEPPPSTVKTGRSGNGTWSCGVVSFFLLAPRSSFLMVRNSERNQLYIQVRCL